ncbi:hypothetical protein D3C77_482760 [compost metagenome]
MRGRGHLVDFAVLLLHAGAGLAGDGCRLVGGAASILHRGFDVGDYWLQLVEKAIEPTDQFAQLVLARVVQTAGEVAFTAGNILEHGGNVKNRPGYTSGGHPDHDQAHYGGSESH